MALEFSPDATFSEASKALLGSLNEFQPESIDTVKSIMVKNTLLHDENERLKQESRDVVDRISVLENNHQDDRVEVQRLTTEIQGLKHSNSSLRKKNQELTDSNSSLSQSNQKLSAALQNVQQGNLTFEQFYQSVLTLIGQAARSNITQKRNTSKHIDVVISCAEYNYEIVLDRMNEHTFYGMFYQLDINGNILASIQVQGG